MPSKGSNRKQSNSRQVSSPNNFTYSAGSQMPSPLMNGSPVLISNHWSPRLPQTPPQQASSSFGGKIMSSLKQLTRSPHSSARRQKHSPEFKFETPVLPQMPVQFRSHITPVSNSSSASSGLSSAADWSSSHTMSSPDTSPESFMKNRPPIRRQLQPAAPIPQICVRAVTPPPTHRLNAPMTSDHTPYSPPFDPAFEQAAASSLALQDGIADSDRISGLGLQARPLKSSLISARIPSMRFDDLSVFISDLEARLCEANGKSEIPVPPLPVIKEKTMSKRSSRVSSRASRQNMSQLIPSDSQSSLAFLTSSSSDSSISSATTAPLKPKNKLRVKRASAAGLPPINVPARTDARATAVPPSPSLLSIEFIQPSPRRSSLAQPGQALLDSAFPEPPQLKIQPPTPVLIGTEFAQEPPKERKRSQHRLPRVHRIPSKSTSAASPSSSIETFSQRSTSSSTPPLSPSSSADTSIHADEEEDGERQLEKMMASLQRPYSSVMSNLNEKGANFPVDVVKIAPEEDQGYQLLTEETENCYVHQPVELTDANLKIHTASALSDLQAATRESLRQFVSAGTTAPVADEYTPTEEEDNEFFRFEDAPLLREEIFEKTVVSDAQSRPANSTDGDLGLAQMDASGSSGSDMDSIASWSPSRERRRKAGESLWDLDSVVVSMADRIAVHSKLNGQAGGPGLQSIREVAEIGIAL